MGQKADDHICSSLLYELCFICKFGSVIQCFCKGKKPKAVNIPLTIALLSIIYILSSIFIIKKIKSKPYLTLEIKSKKLIFCPIRVGFHFIHSNVKTKPIKSINFRLDLLVKLKGRFFITSKGKVFILDTWLKRCFIY